ncbi:MAG: GNAT family N-acetyltransferase [Candidatus Absconditicoccaceae bacterium]
MKILKFEPKDAIQVCNLIHNTADNIMKHYESQASIDALKEERTPEKLLEKLNNRDYIIAQANGKIIGVGGIKDNEIRSMFVDYNYIRQGIGTKIIVALENIAKKNKHKKIIVKANAGAIGFYKKMGYISIKEYDEIVGKSTYRVILMEKLI